MTKRLTALIVSLVLLLSCLTLPALAEDNKFYFDKTVRTVFEGESFTPPLVRMGECREEGPLTFASSRESVATVDENGVITGVSKGTATIQASLTTQRRTWKCTIEVSVLRKVSALEVTTKDFPVHEPTDPVVAHLLSPNVDEEVAQLPVLLLSVGKNQSVNISVTPKDASNRKFELFTEDETIVRVSSNTFSPRKAGECIVGIRSVQNPEVALTYRALVVQPATKVSVSAPAKYTYVGGALQLTAAVSPDDATIKDVTWSSSNERVATVNAQGMVVGVSKGSATIKATAADGSKRYGTYTVQVRQQPESIELNQYDLEVNVDDYRTLRATVLPSDTNDKTVTWSTSDASVAKVNTSGRVTGVGPGVATITCQSKDFPEVSVTATVTVLQPVKSITFQEKTVSVDVNNSVTVYWNVSPYNASNPSVTLTSSNDSIASVSQDGTVYAHKRGECTIRATANDGSGRYGTMKIRVTQPVEGVHMKNDTVMVGVDESASAYAVLEPSDASDTGMTWYSADPSIATVRGSSTKATVTGKNWGTTTITGVTDDGGYSTTATVKVGNYDKAVRITDLYLQDDKVKITVRNDSDMTITKFYFTIELYDLYGQPLTCNENGSNVFNGSYGYTLYQGDSTRHGRFYFENFVQPEAVGKVVMRITGYRTEDGYSRDIRTDKQIAVDYCVNGYTEGLPQAPQQTPELLP